MVSAPSAAKPVRQMNVTGTVRTSAKVPVLANSLRNGDLIGASDIDYINIFESDIQPDMILNGDHLVGMMPRRMIMSGKPIRTVDLQAPQLVERGKNVTIIFNEGPLKLTAMGKALQNGAKGDLIRVVNNASNRPIDAYVNGAGEVVVRQ
jgi:flagella basal body P-ring formation protein FlgA